MTMRLIPKLLTCNLLVLAALARPAGAAVPSLVYENALPGYTIPSVRDLTVDDAGNAYVVATAYENRIHGDILAVKYDPTGSPVWTRYVTADNHCFGLGIAVNSQGDVWLAGWTSATDFPLVGAIDSTLTGNKDGFLMRLAGSDGSITFSTYFGAEAGDSFEGVAINAADEILVVGWTNSSDYPVTPGAYQLQASFPQNFYTDAVITKFSPDGATVLYSTYLGGLVNDRGTEIVLDGAGNIIVAGSTGADDFPLASPVQSIPDDIFVAQLSADGTNLMFGTYWGGEDLDYVNDIAVDDVGRIYLVGTTRSEGLPTTSGAFQESFVGTVLGCEVPFGQDHNCEDLFVTKLATDPGTVIWSTYLGGGRVEEARGIAVDAAGGVLVTGYTVSPDFPPAGVNLGAGIIVSRLTADGSALEYTYLVESGSANRGNGIAVGPQNDVYFAGTLGVPASVYLARLGGVQVASVGRDVPGAVALLGNFPNPFNPRTTISFAMAAAGPVNLAVFDVSGGLVRHLLTDEALAAGPHTAAWNGRDAVGRPVPSGVYFYRLDTGRWSGTKRMLLMK